MKWLNEAPYPNKNNLKNIILNCRQITYPKGEAENPQFHPYQ